MPMSHRLHIRLLPRDQVLLEQLLSNSGGCSKSELVRASIDLLSQAWEQATQGNRVVLRNVELRLQHEIALGRIPRDPVDDASSDSPLSSTFEIRVSDDLMSTINRLVGIVAKNQTEVVREALSLCTHIHKWSQEGWQLSAIRPSGDVTPLKAQSALSTLTSPASTPGRLLDYPDNSASPGAPVRTESAVGISESADGSHNIGGQGLRHSPDRFHLPRRTVIDHPSSPMRDNHIHRPNHAPLSTQFTLGSGRDIGCEHGEVPSNSPFREPIFTILSRRGPAIAKVTPRDQSSIPHSDHCR